MIKLDELYSQLISRGYTEKIIKKILSESNQLRFNEKTVDAITENGKQRRVTLNENVTLLNGRYILVTDIIKSLADYLEQSGKNINITCKRQNKKINVTNFIEDLLITIPTYDHIIVDNKNPYVLNPRAQYASQNTVSDLILGLANNKVSLPNGEYIDFNEVKKALMQYVFSSKKNVPRIVQSGPYNSPIGRIPGGEYGPHVGAAPGGEYGPHVGATPGGEYGPHVGGVPGSEYGPHVGAAPGGEYGPHVGATPGGEYGPHVGATPGGEYGPHVEGVPGGEYGPHVGDAPGGEYGPSGENIPQEENEVHTVIKRKPKNIKIWPLIMASIVSLLLALNVSVNKSNLNELAEFNCEAYGVKCDTIYIAKEGTTRNALGDLKTGDSVPVESGTNYYASSDYLYGGNSNSGTFGSVTRPEGMYTLEYISIIDNEKISKVVYEQGQKLSDIINTYCSENNRSFSDLEVMVHIGGPVSGWVNITTLLGEENFNQQIIIKEIRLDDCYSGTISLPSQQELIKSLAQNGININVDGKTVNLKCTDDNGNLLPTGSVVIGSDGNEYRLTKLEFKEQSSGAIGDAEIYLNFQSVKKEILLLNALGGLATVLLNINRETGEYEEVKSR